VNFNNFFLLLFLGLYGCNYVSKPNETNTDNSSLAAKQDSQQQRIILGGKLFFDKRLSRNNNISCGSCHIPESAYADTISVNQGTGGHSNMRNTPSLLNSSFSPHYMSEGKVPDLEQASIVPLLDENEMNTDIKKLIFELNSDSTYKTMFIKAFNSKVDTRSLVRALASFQRSLISSGSRFDSYQLGNRKLMTDSEIRGMKLFYSDRTNCSSCHSGILFTNYSIVSVGLGDTDKGLMRATELEADKGKFKTPGLRNVAITKPYMHNGSLKTLDEVLHYYNRGGNHGPGQDKRIKPLRLSKTEIQDIKAFLISLNDTVLPKFVP
jgi:cytochrome c peroxidase